MRTEFDVVIIGSGAGGAPIAYELARAGKSVLVLEKGPLFRTQGERGPNSLSDFKRDEMFNAGHEKIINVAGVSNQGAPYYASPVEPDLNDEPHIYSDPDVPADQRVTMEGYTAQCVGGGTQLYGAVSLRFAPDDFRLKSANADQPRTLGNDDGTALRDVQDWPIGYDDLRPYYEKAEELVGINGTVKNQAKPFASANKYQKPLEPNPISKFALDGMNALGFKSYRTPLAVITEDHAPSGRTVPKDENGKRTDAPKTAYVNRYGDPMGYKSNTWVSLLKPTIEDDAGFDLEIRPNCNVTHISSNGDQVSGVHYVDASGSNVTVTGKVVCVACSAIESVRLLMLSSENDLGGFGQTIRYNQSDILLGAFFLTHCFGGAEVAIPNQRFDKSISMDSDYATDACVDPDFLLSNNLWAGAAIYNNTSDQALPVTLARNHMATDLDTNWLGFAGDTDLRGDAILNWFDRDFGTRLSVSFMANQIPQRRNRILLHNVRDKWGRKVAHIAKGWHAHDGFLMERIAAICEDILLGGVPGSRRNPDPNNPNAPGTIEEGSVYGQGVRIANHILGGARFGLDPSSSVLDKDCRVWGFDNLYVTDGSFMPTSGSANPTLTIQANAFRIADHLKSRL